MDLIFYEYISIDSDKSFNKLLNGILINLCSLIREILSLKYNQNSLHLKLFKFNKVFILFQEEEFDARYSNLFYPIEKQHMHCIESLPHPPVIALIMRRQSGIQALEVHVLLARSTVEAKSIVNSIRNVCSKYSFDQTQQSRVFQYKPYIDPNDEQHLDLITNLNTSSNGMSSSKKKHKLKSQHNLSTQNKKNGADLSNKTAFSKSETSLTSKHSVSLFDKLKANLKESSSIRLTKQTKSGIAAMPPLPNKNEDIKSPRKRFKLSNKFMSNKPQIECDMTSRPSSVVSKNLSQQSMASMGSFDEKKSQTRKEKKPSLGKRLLSSLNSKSTKNLSSKSSTSITVAKESQLIQTGLSDVDFRKSRTSFIDENLLIDDKGVYPIVHAKPPLSAKIKMTATQVPVSYSHGSTNDANFFLKSKHDGQSSTPSLSVINKTTGQTFSQTSKNLNYLSSPSLVTESNYLDQQLYYRSPGQPVFSYSRNSVKVPTVRAKSAAAPTNRSNDSYLGKKSFSNEYTRSSSSNQCRYECESEDEIRFSRKIKSPVEDANLLSNHLVWNKISKSAESLDKRSPTTHMFCPSPARSHFESESIIARAISPGLPLKESQQFAYKPSLTDRDTSFGLNRDHKIASNINSIINTNRNFNRTTSTSSTEKKLESNEIKIRISPPILSDCNKFNEGSTNSNNRFTSFVAIGNDSSSNFSSSVLNANNLAKVSKLSSGSDEYQSHSQRNMVKSGETDFKSTKSATNSVEHFKSYHEEISANVENGTKASNHHCKRVGGIKVFPTLPHEHKQAALIRQNRMNEEHEYTFVDSERKEAKTDSEQHFYSTSLTIDDSDNDHEIIDLTKDTKNLNITKPTGKIFFETNQNLNKSNFSNIPIEIFISNESKSVKTAESLDKNKFGNIQSQNTQSANNKIVSTTFVSPFNDTTRKPTGFIKEPDVANQHSYIYYYDDDEAFGGY